MKGSELATIFEVLARWAHARANQDFEALDFEPLPGTRLMLMPVDEPEEPPPGETPEERKRRKAAARQRRRRGLTSRSERDGPRDERDRDPPQSVTPSVTERDSRHASPPFSLPHTPSQIPRTSNKYKEEEEPGVRHASSVTERDSRHAADDAETIIPLDLLDRARRAGVFTELVGRMKGVVVSQLERKAERFVGYWSIGGGAGKRRRNWMARLRQELLDSYEQGKLPPPDADTIAPGQPVRQPYLERQRIEREEAHARAQRELEERGQPVQRDLGLVRSGIGGDA